MVNQEGEIQPQKPEEKIEPKALKQTRKKVQPKATEFPATARINKYGFLHFKKRWLEELGWAKGVELRLDKAPEGIILKKA